MKCKNCGKDKEEHYVTIREDRKQKLKNILLWCYPLSKSISIRDKRYMMQYEENDRRPAFVKCPGGVEMNKVTIEFEVENINRLVYDANDIIHGEEKLKVLNSQILNKTKVEEESKIREALVTKPLSKFDKEILINRRKELQK